MPAAEPMTRLLPSAFSRFLPVLAAALLLFAGDSAAQLAAEGDNQLQESTKEVDVASPEGRFRTVWPAGCSRLRTLTYARQDPGEQALAAGDTLASVVVMCDRRHVDEQGAMVRVVFPVPGGEAHAPADVSDLIGGLIAKSGQQVLRQGTIERNGMRGVRVLARENEGSRSSWIEGFIVKGRIVVAMAWKPDGSVFSSSEVERFFDELRILD